MPHKFNANRRDKISKQKHRATNWVDYNEGLRYHSNLTVWISQDALALWAAPRRTTRGGQPRYSDLVIKLCLTLGLVFKQPLRQTYVPARLPVYPQDLQRSRMYKSDLHRSSF